MPTIKFEIQPVNENEKRLVFTNYLVTESGVPLTLPFMYLRDVEIEFGKVERALAKAKATARKLALP